MKNKYFNELIKEVESFEKFWHKKYFQVNCRGKRIYKNFNDYYQKVQDTKKEETEKYNNPNRKITKERQKEIKNLIINETTIKKGGLDFIIFTFKTKQYDDLDNIFSYKSFTVYNTSVIVHCEEREGNFVNARDIENTFTSISRTKTKAKKDFEKTCELVNNLTIEELIEKIKEEIKVSKSKWKGRFDKEIEERKNINVLQIGEI